MLRTLAAFAAAAALAAVAGAQTPPMPPLLLQAIDATDAAKAPFAFDLDIASGERNWRLRFDPTTSPRLRLLHPSAESLDSGERRTLERLNERMEGISWCASAAMGRVRNVRLLREDAETATYAFQPTRESVNGEQAGRFADRLRGEFTLLKAAPDIAGVRIYAPRPFSPLPLVSVEALEVNVNCAAAPNGRRYAAETVSAVRGSAFGQSFDENSTQRAHSLRGPD